MKIRGLLAGLLIALALAGCSRSPVAAGADTVRPSYDDTAPPPPDSTGRGGGPLGSGN